MLASELIGKYIGGTIDVDVYSAPLLPSTGIVTVDKVKTIPAGDVWLISDYVARNGRIWFKINDDNNQWIEYADSVYNYDGSDLLIDVPASVTEFNKQATGTIYDALVSGYSTNTLFPGVAALEAGATMIADKAGTTVDSVITAVKYTLYAIVALVAVVAILYIANQVKTLSK